MQNISRFEKVNQYLPILNSVIITDIFIIVLLLSNFISSKVLKQWYNQYGIGAVIADVLIIVIGIIIARYLYPKIFSEYALWKFILLAVGIQIIHDISFYLFVKWVPPGKSGIIDVFRAYGKESGVKAILADSFMMIMACLLASVLSSANTNTNIIILIVSVYLIPYLIFSIQ